MPDSDNCPKAKTYFSSLGGYLNGRCGRNRTFPVAELTDRNVPNLVIRLGSFLMAVHGRRIAKLRFEPTRSSQFWAGIRRWKCVSHLVIMAFPVRLEASGISRFDRLCDFAELLILPKKR